LHRCRMRGYSVDTTNVTATRLVPEDSLSATDSDNVMIPASPLGAYMASSPRPSSILHFGSYELNPATCELHKAGIPLKLHPQPFRVLLLLASRQGQVVDREEIQHALWGDNTFVDFEGGINFCIRQVRDALGDNAEKPRYIETLPRRGYRFIAPVSHADLREHVIPFPHSTSPAAPVKPSVNVSDVFPSSAKTRPRPLPTPLKDQTVSKRNILRAAVIGLSLVMVLTAGAVFYFPHPTKLTEKDTIVLADFSNTTGDAVFDDTLKQALTTELGQSPFLNVLPDRRTNDVLRMMGRPTGERVTADTGREICLRTGSKALLAGAISSLGSRYLLDLTAVACGSGETLAKTEAEAANKEDVLKALSRTASSLRSKLGESLPSVQKFDVPIEATTISLEALKNYSMGARVGWTEGDAASIPFIKRAIELDPNFAVAYAALARRYINVNQPSTGFAYAAKAYELRDRVTEREKLRISAVYFRAQGDLEKLDQIFEVWKSEYPRDSGPHGSLCVSDQFIGQYEKALTECQEALRLDPDIVTHYVNLAQTFLNLNRLDESKMICDQALARKLQCPVLYYGAFLRGDSAEMAQQVASVAGKPGDEDTLLSAQSDTEAYFGRLKKAREFSRRAVDSAVRSGLQETAALWQVNAALREAEYGEVTEARRGVAEALKLAPGRNVKIFAAIALARIGETAQAKALAKELERSYPSNTVLKIYWLPVINAATELKVGNLSKSFSTLEGAAPYELAQPSPNQTGTLYPAYLRGQAYLLAHNGPAAAAEFQKLIDHRGIVMNFITGALAHLQLARCLTISGDIAKAKAAYQDFLSLWKDADSDNPLLLKARAEFAHLP
jgi:DNA-binding winged helix-turn-helix (wHTH) protein/tetratricopeptide (TPR) repeat protein